ncbi:NADPH-dependent oxidoreductase [Gordonia sp. ABSL1-1]|uniref:NADPH-dependent oxidoreductase n=1 Tax=Gordonia sp. ABSL1-1 TaxID=3053923 RepID=UPI00257385D5|nr:NADPH-dependent oxidoreductase [Gordonia sp. ABSL1-1]MDL9937798.1 NADPH-dependent oxidoreductase [Gordonia sp. ABSL1-1]
MPIAERYADPDLRLEVDSPVIAAQLAHRSVRQFLDTPVDDATLHAVVAAAQSASTSSNLQPWSVIAVRDPERKARLAALANHQQFINQAPLLLVWVADLDRAHRLAASAAAELTGADYLESTIVGVVDTALAAQNAVVAAESLGLGTVFVGAIRNQPRAVATELALPPHTFATFGLAVGTPDPQERSGIKPRLPQRAVLHRETYDATHADGVIADYDDRLAGYNERYGLPGNWSERVLARLANASSLNGRDRLRADLEYLGLPSV